MNLEAIDLPPQAIAILRREILPQITRELKKHDAWFEARGHDVARAAIMAVFSSEAPKVAPAGERPPKTGPPPEKLPDLLRDIVEPAIAPISRGAKAEIRPLLIGFGIGMIAWSVIMIAVGRAIRKCPSKIS